VEAVMTRYIAAYDTEKANNCLSACRLIRQVHERFDFPATFFVVGKRLEEAGAEYRSVLDGPLFEIASHTYSHKMLRDHPFCGPAPDRETRLEEVRKGKECIEETFARPCTGMRPGCGFSEALHGDAWLVEAVADHFKYVSSLLWGPDTTVPALLERPFTYAEDGRPDLWELPGHGWHENLLKSHNLTTETRRIVAWPFPLPKGVPPRPIQTPEEEFEINRIFIDQACEMNLPYVSLIWHPWSLMQFDPDMHMLELTFAYVQNLGLQSTTYEAEWQRLSRSA